jgi:phospholipid/cholesterol/gamma-HCH transport system substrate-binding protein
MFVIAGLALFVLTIYLVGKQKNLFGSTFHLKAQFKTVSGLKAGNNVRFSGINVGTVSEIEFLTDTSIMVYLLIKKEVQQFIKTDAQASIGSDGLMGDKVFTISPGTDRSSTQIKNGDMIVSKKAIEMEDIMSSLKTSVDNAGIITAQLAQFAYKMNNGNGALSKLISDQDFSNSLKNTITNLQTSSNEFAHFTTKLNNGNFNKALDSTMLNIQGATKGLNENMEAAKHNILLKGYFNKKKRAEAKKQDSLKKVNNLKKIDEGKGKGNIVFPLKSIKDSIKK